MKSNLKIIFSALWVIIYGCNQNNSFEGARLETQKFKDGISRVVGATVNGKKQGLWLTYNDSGKILTNRTYVNDSLIGEEITYLDNGKISSRHYLKGEEIQGEWIRYYDFENNRIGERGKYKDGKKTGIWEYYIEDGRLDKKIEYNDNRNKTIINNHLNPEIPSKH